MLRVLGLGDGRQNGSRGNDVKGASARGRAARWLLGAAASPFRASPLPLPVPAPSAAPLLGVTRH